MFTLDRGSQAATESTGPVRGGRLVARNLKDRGVSHLFTLSGGYLFSIYDGCKAEDIKVIDTATSSRPLGLPRAGSRRLRPASAH